MLAANITWTGSTELHKSSNDGVVLLQSAASVIQYAGGVGRTTLKWRPASARARSSNDAVCSGMIIDAMAPSKH